MTGDKLMDNGGVAEESSPSCVDESCCPPKGNTKPFVRTEQKVGRNDPCPCGNGRKFKKCCGKLG